MRLFSWLIIIPLFFLTKSCLEPVPISGRDSNRRVVVDGMITNVAGPHHVTLKFSQRTDAAAKDAVPIKNAKVIVTENGHTVQILTEHEPGIYVSDSTWRAVIGNTYQLRIETNDGKEYVSSSQQLMDPGTIDNLYVRFERDGLAYGTDGSSTQDAVNVYVDASNLAGLPLRWQFSGRFHAKTYPELRILDLPSGPVPNPPPCSGYINDGGELVQVGECTCCDCYPFDVVQKLSITETSYTTGHHHREVLVARIPARPLRFINKYHVEVEQFSVSEEVYSFWRLVKHLQESGGNIFQPNSVKVRGNIRAVSTDEEVLGIFAVSGVTKASMFLDATVYPYLIQPEVLAEECDQVFSNATYDKPSYWP